MGRYKWLLFLITILSFSNLEIESNNDIKYSYEKKNTSKLSYNFNFLNLKYKHDENIAVSANFFSNRDNININNFYNYDLEKSKRYNQDLSVKLNTNIKTALSNNFNMTNDITYYVYNFSKLDSVYFEKDKKEVLGNFILASDVKGKFLNTDVLIKLGYKANNLYDFTKDESYFKFSTDFKHNESLNLDFNYDFYLDLHHIYTLLDEEKNPFNEEFTYIDAFDQMYNTYFKQTANMSINKNSNIFKINAIHRFIASKNSLKNDASIIYNQFIPTLDISKQFSLNKLVLTPGIALELEYMNAKYIGDATKPNSYDNALKISPKAYFETKYLNENEKINSKVNFKVAYNPTVILIPVINNDDILHTFALKLDSNVKYKLSNNYNLVFDTTNNIEIKAAQKVETIKSNNKIKFELENKNIKSSFVDSLSVSRAGKKLDKLSNSISLGVNTSYLLLNNLTLKNEVKATNDLNYGFDLTANNNPYMKDILTSFSYLFKAEYMNKVLSNLSISTNFEIKSTLDILLLIQSELESYYGAYIPSDLEALKVYSPIIGQQPNIGGSIYLKPEIVLSYNILENLALESTMYVKVLFDKDIKSKVDDKNRLDNKLYKYAPKTFDYRKTIFGAGLNLKYTW